MSIEIPKSFFVSTGKPLVAGGKDLGMARKIVGNSTDKKAIASISKWIGGYNSRPKDWSPDIIENSPVSGFEITGYVSRYTTDNKWFEVADPRGFKLQISCENLFELIDEESISNRVIQTECVWGFHNHVYLMSVHGSAYKKAMQIKSKTEARKKATASSLVVGKLYEKGISKELMIYLGQANFKAHFKEYTPRWQYSASPIPEKEVEENGYYLFLSIHESDLNNKNYTGNCWRGLNLTKTCPTIFESNKTTIHDAQSAKGWLQHSTGDYVPYNIQKLSGFNTVGYNKFIYIKVPEIGFDKTY